MNFLFFPVYLGSIGGGIAQKTDPRAFSTRTCFIRAELNEKQMP
jgi:hypothetical protein